jgi:RNA polymerase sigma-70 factor (ECF subfamily)
MILLRFDRRLQGRVDPSDIIQDAYLDAASRLSEYAAKPTIPFYVWLRLLAAQRLIEQYRKHLGVQARDLSRELTLYHGAVPEATTGALAAQLLGQLTTPSEAAIRAERQVRLQEALNQMDPIDREILALRHFEQMSNGDVATALELDKSAASKRYARALVRLKNILRDMGGGLESL